MKYSYWHYGKNHVSHKNSSWNNTKNRKVGTGHAIRNSLILQENYHYYSSIYGDVFRHPRRMIASYWNEYQDDWEDPYRDNSAGWKSHKNKYQYESKIKRENKVIKRSHKCGLF